MENLFITDISIEKVRHLENIEINISKDERKNLIITGKNGSGKTSVLEAVANTISVISSGEFNSPNSAKENIKYMENGLEKLDLNTEAGKSKKIEVEQSIAYFKAQLDRLYKGITLLFPSIADVNSSYSAGDFVVAYYMAQRDYKVPNEKSIENIELKNTYDINEKPNAQFIKYLVALKSKEALAARKGEMEKANQITNWFNHFENLLKQIFDDKDLKLDFDIDTFAFTILQTGHNPFDFNTMSSGYSAILEIVVDLMMRMENKQVYNVQGVVLIDEIETHLHLELQKNIMPFLKATFPNIQFIVTTHSPFIVTSDPNAVVYDLENKNRIENMNNYSYEGAVEGYFGIDKLSQTLRADFNRYKELVNIDNRTDIENDEILNLEKKLDEIPDFLNIDIASEYTSLKFEKEFK